MTTIEPAGSATTPPAATRPATSAAPGNPQGFFGLVSAVAAYGAVGSCNGPGAQLLSTPLGTVSLTGTAMQWGAAALAFLAPSLLSGA